MATTPRYIGTTAAAAVAYIQASMETDVFLRIFDADGDGVIAASSSDETELARAVCRAETTVDEVLGASHGAPFSATAFAALPAGTQDAIKECVLERTPWERVKLRSAMSDEKKAPYRSLWNDAMARLKRLATDNLSRLPGAGAPEPTRSLAGIVTADADDASQTWGNLANGTIVGF